MSTKRVGRYLCKKPALALFRLVRRSACFVVTLLIYELQTRVDRYSRFKLNQKASATPPQHTAPCQFVHPITLSPESLDDSTLAPTSKILSVGITTAIRGH